MTNEEKIQIRLDLEGELADKFRAIKRKKGIGNNVDVVRNLISEAFEAIEKED